MDRIKVLIVSSVVPNAVGSGGELILHRHLTSNEEIESKVLSWERFPFRLKLVGKLRELGLPFVSRSWESLFPVLPPSKLVDHMIDSFRPDVLLTVAHGWWHISARKAAKKFKLPLVSLFQDWWPDFPEIPAAFRSRVEREFRRTYSESDVAICVSDEMRKQLGENSSNSVIHPIPSFKRPQTRPPDFTPPLRVVYFGNLREYGSPIEKLLRRLDGSDKVRLEVFGSNPLWTSGAADYFSSRGLYHPFMPSDQLMEKLQCYKAVLVVMSFDAALRRRMMTSFPSKLTDAMQLGVPVIIWGPDYSSAVQWVRAGGRALCVTDPSPSALRVALEEFAVSPSEQERCAKKARETAENEFNPQRIQTEFVDVLRRAIQKDATQNQSAL